jgi:hypothetical protein
MIVTEKNIPKKLENILLRNYTTDLILPVEELKYVGLSLWCLTPHSTIF